MSGRPLVTIDFSEIERRILTRLSTLPDDEKGDPFAAERELARALADEIVRPMAKAAGDSLFQRMGLAQYERGGTVTGRFTRSSSPSHELIHHPLTRTQQVVDPRRVESTSSEEPE